VVVTSAEWWWVDVERDMVCGADVFVRPLIYLDHPPGAYSATMSRARPARILGRVNEQAGTSPVGKLDGRNMKAEGGEEERKKKKKKKKKEKSVTAREDKKEQRVGVAV
jgi:hypothetical protein